MEQYHAQGQEDHRIMVYMTDYYESNKDEKGLLPLGPHGFESTVFRSSCVPSLPAGLGRVGSVRREGVESKKFRETFAKVGLGSRERKKESWAILKESLAWA